VGGWWKPVAIVSGLLLPVVLAAALSSGGSDQSSGSFAGGDESAGVEASGGGGASSGDTAAPAEVAPTIGKGTEDAGGQGVIHESRGGSAKSDARARRSVERSASLTLAAPRRQVDQVASRIGDVTADLGGFVAASSVSSSSGGDLELRVPSNRLDTAIQRLSKLAKVRDLSRRSLDITSQVVSARERLTDARTERVSLLRQLASATTVNETESIRARLRIVSQEIAAARTSLKRVNNRANFANVSVTLAVSNGSADNGSGGAWTPGDAFDDAMRVLEVAAGVAVIAAAVLVPLMVAWLLGWLARRGVTRRRRERALDMA
jgi:hypothetical protein